MNLNLNCNCLFLKKLILISILILSFFTWLTIYARSQLDEVNSDSNEIDFDEDTASDGQLDTNEEELDTQEDEGPILLTHMTQRDAPFFRRSSSTLCLGANAPDPFFYSLEEALPLATRPHLLQPHVRIQDMFRVRSNHIDQFFSLSRMGLMASDQRVQVPVLRGPSLFSSSSHIQNRDGKSLSHLYFTQWNIFLWSPTLCKIPIIPADFISSSWINV